MRSVYFETQLHNFGLEVEEDFQLPLETVNFFVTLYALTNLKSFYLLTLH